MQTLDFERGIWAVVTVSGGKKLIGRINGRPPRSVFTDEIPTESRDDVLLGLTNDHTFTITDALQLVDAVVPVQTPEGPGMTRIVQCMPLDDCLYPAKLYVRAEGIHFFSDMHEDDRARHKALATQAIEALVHVRARQAGIELPHGKHSP